MESRVTNRVRIMSVFSILFILLLLLVVYLQSPDIIVPFALVFIVLPCLVVFPLRYFVMRWKKKDPEGFNKRFPEAKMFEEGLKAEGNDVVVVGKVFSKTSFFKSIINLYKLNFIMALALIGFVLLLIIIKFLFR